MARFVALNFRAGFSCVAAAGLGVMAFFSPALRAQPPMVAGSPAPAKLPATNAAPVKPPIPDTLDRYGKIVMPGTETAHPLKLKLPFPDVGAVKVPNRDELTMRDKLEQLALLSDSDIRAQLEQWPAFGKMSLRDEGAMLQRIQDFRDYRARVAMQKAHDMGLLTLTPGQKLRFEKDYWDKQLRMDHDLAKQFEPILKARQQKLQDELFREFSSGAPGPVAQASAPVAKIKAKAAAAASATNAMQATEPMVEAPR